ncbi:MAG: hypothetical protein H0V55_04780 [Thermoleophilaceae bacterium]|nr:hypothetical protein [Thermoleophilaceae bacterium]
MGDTGRRLILVLCLVLAAAFAPAALAQPSIPDLPGDVDDRVPDDVTDRLPDGDDGEGEDDETDDGLPEVPDLPEVSPEDIAPGLPVPDEVGPQAVLEPPARPNPFIPSPGMPVGSNEYDCVPTAARPNPVVLVHGTFEDRNFSWSFVSPMLKGMGYCVYAINYGNNGTLPIEESAVELRDFVDGVLAAPGTVAAHENQVDGADKVSIVAHSQGGLMSRVYLKEEGGLDKVEDLVSLAASNHGTDNPFARPAEEQGNCDSCGQQFPYERSPSGNEFTEGVNAGDETPRAVSYTQINTRFDDVVFPYFSAFLAESGSRNGPRTAELNGSGTTNFCLQDQFPADTTDHVGTQYDPFTFQVIADALGNDGPADEPDRPDSVCAPIAERGGSGGDGSGGGDDRGGNGNGNGNGGGNKGGDDTGLGFVLTPAFLDGMARHECSARFFNQNFGPAGGRPTKAFLGCVSAANLSLRENVVPEQACTRPDLSRVRVAGERRSDYAACLIAVTRVLGARERIASFFTF